MRDDPIVAIGTLLTVGLSLVLLAAGPIYSDAVAVGALRRSLVDAPASSTAVELSTRAAAGDVETVESVAASAIVDAFGGVDVESSRLLIAGESFGLGESPETELTDLAQLAWIEGIGDEVAAVEGRLPADGEADSMIEVAVDVRAASELGLTVGRRLTVSPRSGGGGPVAIEVVGHYEVSEPFGGFWTGRDRLAEPLTISPTFRTVTLVAPRSALLGGVSTRLEVGTLALPRFDDVGLDDVQPLRRGIVALAYVVNEQVADRELASAPVFEVSTAAPALLSGRDRTFTVARSVVIAVVLQLAVLGAFALVLVAGLAVDARQAESTMLRARGASSAQLVGQAVLDAAVIVVPMAALAPLLGVRLVSLFDERGSLAANGLRLDPSAVRGSWVIVAAAAAVTLVLLAWPALRAARMADATRTRRPRWSGVLQRSGIDIAVLAIAVVSYWQLRTLGDARAATVRGRFGVDPLLIAAPTFGLVAGAFLALRVVPAAARATERLLVRTTTVTPALAGWQLARRPHRYSRSALLLIMAVAIGTFAVAYDATWTASQDAQASQQVAAEGRLEPNRRTGDSVGPLQLAGLVERSPGVSTASPVVTDVAELPASDRPGRFLAVDANRPDVFNDVAAANPRLIAALRRLHDRRPSVAALSLPGTPAALQLEIEAPPEPVPAEPDETIVDDDGNVVEPPPPPPRPARRAVPPEPGHDTQRGRGTPGRPVRPLARGCAPGPPPTRRAGWRTGRARDFRRPATPERTRTRNLDAHGGSRDRALGNRRAFRALAGKRAPRDQRRAGRPPARARPGRAHAGDVHAR